MWPCKGREEKSNIEKGGKKNRQNKKDLPLKEPPARLSYSTPFRKREKM